MLPQFQVNSKGTQPHIHVYPFSPRLPSHSACRRTLSRVPCALQGLFGYPFKMQQCVHTHPKLPTYSYLLIAFLIANFFYQYSCIFLFDFLIYYFLGLDTGNTSSHSVIRLPMQETLETQILFLDQEYPLEKEMATHSSILA